MNDIVLFLYYIIFFVQSFSIFVFLYCSNVLPSELAAAHQDAGVIQFASSATVDISKSAGFKDNRLYCVAPILTPGTLILQNYKKKSCLQNL